MPDDQLVKTLIEDGPGKYVRPRSTGVWQRATLRGWFSSGLEMTVAGVVVGVATYGAGLLIRLVGG